MPGTGGGMGGVRTVVVVVLLTVVLARPSRQLTLTRAAATRPASLTSLDRKLEPEAAPTDNHSHGPASPPSTRDDEGSAAIQASSASDSTTRQPPPPPPPPQLRLAHQPGGASGKADRGSDSSNARHSSRLKGPVVVAARELNTFPQQSAGPARSPTTRRHGPQHTARAAGAALTEYLSGGQARRGAPYSGGGSSGTATVLSARPSRQSSSPDSTATRPHASPDTARLVAGGTRVPTALPLQPRKRRNRHPHRSSTSSVTSGSGGDSVVSESGAHSARRSRPWSSNSQPTSAGSKTVTHQPRSDRPPGPRFASAPDQWPGGGVVIPLPYRHDTAVTSRGTLQHSSGGHKSIRPAALSHRHHNHHHNRNVPNDSAQQSSSPSSDDKPYDLSPPAGSQVVAARADRVSTSTREEKTLSSDHHHHHQPPSSPGHRANPIQVVVIPLGRNSSASHPDVSQEPTEEVLLGIKQEDLSDDSWQRIGRSQSLPHHRQQHKQDSTGEHQDDDDHSVLQTGRPHLLPQDHRQLKLHRQRQHQHQHQRQHQHQASAAKGAPDVSRMVLTVVGSLTAILGACIMAAIFQCCCRRKRTASSSSSNQEGGAAKKGAGQEDEGQQQQQAKGDKQDGLRDSRSKSPSPLKVTSSNHGNHLQADTGLTEQDKLLEDDPDVGDFSNVCRETEILRSYRKPPPPKNRARASRVPRALKTVDPKASPDIFKELVEKEQAAANGVPEPEPKETSVSPEPASRETSASPPVKRQPTPNPNDMHSSMLADIDSTLAAMHSTGDSSSTTTPTASNPTSARDSRRPSAEKSLSPSNTENQLKAPTSKEVITKSPSREELAKALAEKLSRSVSKEALASRLPGKISTADFPKVADKKEPTAKSRSAGPSPKLRTKELTMSHSQDNIRPDEGGDGSGESKDEPRKDGGGGDVKKDTPKKSGNGGSDIPKKNGGSGVKNTTVDVKNVGSAAAAEGDVANGDKKNGGGGVNNASLPPEKEGDQDSGNIFALIDPTIKGEAEGKSKIPVRAASNPTQPITAMRPGSGKEKRFPVPSVHGEQMDQLLKSLKTRLKEDGSSPKKTGNKVSPEGESADDDDLDRQGRNRSNSDPNRQQEEKKKIAYQTQL